MTLHPNASATGSPAALGKPAETTDDSSFPLIVLLSVLGLVLSLILLKLDPSTIAALQFMG